MNQTVEINNTGLTVKEYQKQRVVTFKDIDEVHNRITGTAKKNYHNNRKRFIKGIDYFVISQLDVGEKFTQTYGFNKKAPSGTVFTETGYLMLVKSFSDDLAWEVQRKLVNTYFRAKEIANNNVNISELMEMFQTMFQSTITPLATMMNTLATQMTANTQMVQSLLDKQQEQEFKVPYPQWLNKVQDKIDIIHDNYFPDDLKANGARAYTQTYRKLFEEFTDTYDDNSYLGQKVQDFYMQHKVNVPTMTAVALDSEARSLMETVIDNIIGGIEEIEKINLQEVCAIEAN